MMRITRSMRKTRSFTNSEALTKLPSPKKLVRKVSSPKKCIRKLKLAIETPTVPKILTWSQTIDPHENGTKLYKNGVEFTNALEVTDMPANQGMIQHEQTTYTTMNGLIVHLDIVQNGHDFSLLARWGYGGRFAIFKLFEPSSREETKLAFDRHLEQKQEPEWNALGNFSQFDSFKDSKNSKEKYIQGYFKVDELAMSIQSSDGFAWNMKSIAKVL